MNMHTPVRLSGAEETLIAQLDDAGAHHLATRLRDRGLPTRRVEAYHYTDLKMLLGAVPPLAGRAIVGASALRVPGAHRILVANGTIESTGDAVEGLTVLRTDDAVLTDRDDVLVGLNRSLQGEALVLEIGAGAPELIHIDRRLEGNAGHVAGATAIVVAPGARITVIETITSSSAAHFGNGGTSVRLGEGAEMTHVLVDRSAAAAARFDTVEYHLAARSRLTSMVAHAGPNLARTQMFARFEGEGAHADFRGLNLVDDAQHSDITLDIAHAVPHTTSTERFKQIGRGRCKAVFQGKITVARGAQKTDAQMMTQGLMLSDEAEILAKPELEIFADDVICAHGATCGDLEEGSLFYLMSRGIPKSEAETILVRAFLAEVVDDLGSDSVRGVLETVVDHWLANAA